MLVTGVFWLCLFLLGYIYVGYPLCALVVGALRRQQVTRGDTQPTVTVLISAFNEVREIEHTVRNKLEQDYPADKLKVVVVSDESTDGTDALVERLAGEAKGRVRLLRQIPRQGKTQALNLAMPQIDSEIVVFSDANSVYAPDAIRNLVRCFADTTVGYVTGRMTYTNPDGSAIGDGSGKYMDYENTLRAIETRVGSVVGVDGGVDAVRRALYVPMQADQQPDFVLPLSVVEQGRRVVYAPEALLYEAALSGAGKEFRMRVRVILRALWALYDKRALLNVQRFGVFAWQLWSHKVLRYLAFLPLAGLLFTNVMLFSCSVFFALFLVAQLTCYGLAIYGHAHRDVSAKSTKLMLPYYFVLLNVACAIAAWKFLRGEKMVIWTPRVGA